MDGIVANHSMDSDDCSYLYVVLQAPIMQSRDSSCDIATRVFTRNAPSMIDGQPTCMHEGVHHDSLVAPTGQTERIPVKNALSVANYLDGLVDGGQLRRRGRGSQMFTMRNVGVAACKALQPAQ